MLWKTTIDEFQITASSDELKAFQEDLPFSGMVLGRVAEFFWFDLFSLTRLGQVDPFQVMESIRTLETGRSDGVKPASLFQRLPLKGLWHQHYFSANFVARNMRLGLGQGGLARVIREVMDPSGSPVITQEMISELAHRVTVESIEQRASQNRLTGEWIIFVKAKGQNYYLCLADHQTPDQGIFDRIMTHGVRDFPELSAWMQES